MGSVQRIAVYIVRDQCLLFFLVSVYRFLLYWKLREGDLEHLAINQYQPTTGAEWRRNRGARSAELCGSEVDWTSQSVAAVHSGEWDHTILLDDSRFGDRIVGIRGHLRYIRVRHSCALSCRPDKFDG